MIIILFSPRIMATEAGTPKQAPPTAKAAAGNSKMSEVVLDYSFKNLTVIGGKSST